MFNIITPTYNRKHTLKRVYDSLISQSLQKFNWIIVDDASTDNTGELVNTWINENKFQIQYFAQPENQGKAYAVNYALKHCDQPYTIIADSDDSFSENTLSDLLEIWKFVDASTKKGDTKIASIWTLTVDETGNIVGDLYPKDIWQVSFKERALEHTIEGEKWACWRTDILKTFELYGHKQCYIGESHTWNRINMEYDFLCLNMAHRKYFDSPDGIIASKIPHKKIAMRNYLGAYYGLKDIPLWQIPRYKLFRFYSFEYIKSLPYYRNSDLKLSISKELLSFFIFLYCAPKKLINKLI